MNVGLNNMKSFSERIPAVVLAIFAVHVAASGASGAETCAERFIRARAGELGTMKVDKVVPVETGVLASFSSPGKKGLVVVGMTVVGLDLVTSQTVFGRDNASDVGADESKWLSGLFSKLHPDPEFRACPELIREQKPEAAAVSDVMKAWWKEQTELDNKLSGRTRLPMIILVVSSVLVVLGLAFMIVVRRRRSAGGTEASAVAKTDSEASPVVASTVTEDIATDVGDGPGVSADDDRGEVV